MITVDIPGYKTLQLRHLVLDYNGTLAVGGDLLNGVKERLERLAPQINIHVLTADTFGGARSALADVPCEVFILPEEAQDARKFQYIEQLGIDKVVAIGNGCNDRLMIKAAELGIVVTQAEGTAVSTLTSADLVTPTILNALDLLLHPLRLKATLRS